MPACRVNLVLPYYADCALDSLAVAIGYRGAEEHLIDVLLARGVHDLGEVEGMYYITMEFVEGQSLKHLIQSRGHLPVNVALMFPGMNGADAFDFSSVTLTQRFGDSVSLLAGKIKVQGDMTKMMALQAGGQDPVAAQVAERIKDITE